jgi:cytochrome c-type biogenesis protein
MTSYNHYIIIQNNINVFFKEWKEKPSLEWYYQLSQFLAYFSQPFTAIYYSTEIPLAGALLLGIVGALAPCQITANLGTISYALNQIGKEERWNGQIIYFFLGKTFVYFLLGFLVIWIGKGLEESTIPIFQIIRKMMGPLFLITGLYFVGLIKIKGVITERLLVYERFINNMKGNGRWFLLGVLFSLAFCPTMFLLFFGLLMPLVLNTTGYGFALPFVFSIGTFMPVLLLIGLAYGFGWDRSLLKNSKKFGKLVQVLAGVTLILLGINDILLYWTI